MNQTTGRTSAAILISGGGSNLQAFINAVNTGSLDLELRVVISNNAGAGGLRRAQKAQIPVKCVDHSGFPSREAFDTALIETLSHHNPDIIVLAGFMRILTPDFIRQYSGRVFNIHPSLLPAYPGLNTHQRAIDAGDRWHGSTVHFATEELDGGPGIIQGRVRITPGDTADTLAARVLRIEHRIYPKAVGLFVAGRLTCDEGVAFLDGEPLNEPIQFQGRDIESV